MKQLLASSGLGLTADTIDDYNGAPGIGPGEAFNMQLALKITLLTRAFGYDAIGECIALAGSVSFFALLLAQFLSSSGE